MCVVSFFCVVYVVHVVCVCVVFGRCVLCVVCARGMCGERMVFDACTV